MVLFIFGGIFLLSTSGVASGSTGSASFSPPHSDYGLDTDGDNLYNYLAVDVGVGVNEAGEYEINANLYDNEGNYVDGSGVENYLKEGTYTLQIKFDGYRIRDLRENAPYRVDLDLYGNEGNKIDADIYWADNYSWSDFEEPEAELTPPRSDYGLDTDGDNLYNYLVVETRVEIKENGGYLVEQ